MAINLKIDQITVGMLIKGIVDPPGIGSVVGQVRTVSDLQRLVDMGVRELSVDTGSVGYIAGEDRAPDQSGETELTIVEKKQYESGPITPESASFAQALPPLTLPLPHVVMFDPDPRLVDSSRDFFAHSDLGFTGVDSAQKVLLRLTDLAPPDSFPVVALGEDPKNDGGNNRIGLMKAKFPYLPIIFLSTMDISKTRREAFLDGATVLQIKPDMAMLSFSNKARVLKGFNNELLETINRIYLNHSELVTAYR